MTRRRFVKATAIALPSRAIARTKVFLAKQYHSQPPRSHLDLFLRKIWDTVRAETGGDLNVTVYPQNGGVPLGDPEVLTQLQAGSPEFFTLNGNILSNVQPEADIQGIPFAFTSSLQVAALNDGDYGEYLRSKLVAKNIQLLPFGGMENGFKQITSVDRPIRNVDDLRGIKMRIPNGKLFYEFYNDLGAIPKIINFNQLYNALAKRDVDGQENPLVDVEDNKFYQVCKYVGLSSHQWAGYNMLANQNFWQDLPQDIRDVVIRNTTRFVPEQRAFVQALNAKAAAVLQKQGMTLIRVDVESLRQKLSDAGFYKKWRVSCGETAWRLMEAQSGPVG
jgi:TRAP-type transport system periplasmic protein